LIDGKFGIRANAVLKQEIQAIIRSVNQNRLALLLGAEVASTTPDSLPVRELNTTP
jgi:hypothetical protein